MVTWSEADNGAFTPCKSSECRPTSMTHPQGSSRYPRVQHTLMPLHRYHPLLAMAPEKTSQQQIHSQVLLCSCAGALSKRTLRPLGPRVTATVSASFSMPRINWARTKRLLRPAKKKHFMISACHHPRLMRSCGHPPCTRFSSPSQAGFDLGLTYTF